MTIFFAWLKTFPQVKIANDLLCYSVFTTLKNISTIGANICGEKPVVWILESGFVTWSGVFEPGQSAKMTINYANYSSGLDPERIVLVY